MWRGADGDGVYDGPCWPHAGYDNCPDVYNPDQTDYVDNYRSEYHVGYACRTYDCGNGEIDGYEQCDDGNTNNNDGCKNDCTYNNCGDGYPNYNSYGAYGYGREACDDGNYSYGDGCTPNCCCR